MPGRQFSAGSAYRYGFNGKENDNDVAVQDYGLRIYNPALGKFLSVDPLTSEFPELTPYQFASNSPIEAIDLDGAEAQSSKHANENSTQKPQQPSLLEQLDGALLGGQYKHEKKVNALEVGIKQQTGEVLRYKDLKQQAMNDLMSAAPGSPEAKASLNLYSQYDKEQQAHVSNLKFLIVQRYKTLGEDKAIENYQDVIDKQLRMLAFGTNAMVTAASFIPSGGSSAGFFASTTEIRASIFSLGGGYGVFGKGGLRIGGYKVEALYSTPRVGYSSGTIFSIKQIGTKGGNFLRWDYGVIHGSNKMGLHSSFRFNVGGKTFGSSGQYPWYAPFKFRKYLR